MILLTSLATVGCGAESVSAQSGLTEPIQVSNGQFFQGNLPQSATGPQVRSLAGPNNAVRQGQSGWALTGDADTDAWAVALRFADLGTGYWIVPVLGPDLLTPGNLLWTARIDFARDLPPGAHDMQVVAIAGDQTAGPLTPAGTKRLTAQSLLPNADTVLSLEWDTDADLDLHLTGPLESGGGELSPKQPSTAPFDTASGMFPPGTGLLDRDSNAHCVRDGFRRENVVWNSHEAGMPALGPPLPGNYIIRVDMFDACGQAYANFKVTLFEQGTAVFVQEGRLLSIDADRGGPGAGLFVAQIVFGP